MDITSKRAVVTTNTVTITLDDREAKLLCCLIGSLSTTEAEDLIQSSFKFDEWIAELGPNEMSSYVQFLYDGLHEKLL